MSYFRQLTERIRRFVIAWLRGRKLRRVRCPHCGEGFAKLDLIVADDIWDETMGHVPDAHRDIWAFCLGCQTTYDFSLLRMRFVVSESSDQIRKELKEIEAEKSKTSE
jgi:hypothetical protein